MLLQPRVALGLTATVVTALVIGVPTGVIETPWYQRMTPVLWWNYPVWAVTSILTGALLSTYVRDPTVEVPPSQGTRTLMGGMLSLFAVGCPICNKVVVMAIGASGALNVFAPIQPFLAVGSVVLLTYALWARRRATIACRVDVGLGA